MERATVEGTVVRAFQQALDDLEKTADYMCLEFAGSSLGIYCDDPDVIPWVSQYFAGYFVSSKSKDVEAVIYMSRDVALLEQLYSRVVAAREPDAPEDADVELALDDEHLLRFDGYLGKEHALEKICYMLSLAERKILAAFTGPTKVRRVLANRLVPDTMRLLMYEKGWLPVHASACVRNGAGVGIVGGRFAGKTSTLFNLLDQPGTKLVTNGQLFVRDAGTYLEGCGFPTKAGLRVGTLFTTPKLQRWVEEATDTFYPQPSAEELHEIAASTPAAELQARPEKIRLVPSELAASFGVEIQLVTPIDLFVAITYVPELEESYFAPMDKEEFVSFVTSVTSLAKKQKVLRKFFAYSDDVMREKLGALLGKYYPDILVRELHQNEHTTSQSLALIDASIAAEIAHHGQPALIQPE